MIKNDEILLIVGFWWMEVVKALMFEYFVCLYIPLNLLWSIHSNFNEFLFLIFQVIIITLHGIFLAHARVCNMEGKLEWCGLQYKGRGELPRISNWQKCMYFYLCSIPINSLGPNSKLIQHGRLNGIYISIWTKFFLPSYIKSPIYKNV